MSQIEQQKAEGGFMPERPKNWIPESIIVMLLLMFPLGLVALVYGFKVNNNYDLGDYKKSVRRSKQAARWNLYGVLTGVPINIFFFFFWDK